MPVCGIPLLARPALVAVVLMLAPGPVAAGQTCDQATAGFTDWLADRYGAEAGEVATFSGGETADRWGIAASMYIVAAEGVLSAATPETRDLPAGPFVPTEAAQYHAPTASDLALAAELLMLAGTAADCLRAPGTAMLIDDADMGSEFDKLFPPVRRSAIGRFAEAFL